MTLALSLLAGEPAPAVLRTPGLHLVNLADGGSRWLGPGGSPGWFADSRRLATEAAHGPIAGPPFGPIYAVGIDRAAQGLRDGTSSGGGRPSPSGRFLAVLTADGPKARLQILDAAAGRPVAAPAELGALTPARLDAYAWLPDGDRLVFAVEVGPPDLAGLYVWDGGTARRVSSATGDGVWPAPDGRVVAVRQAGAMLLADIARPDEPPIGLLPAGEPIHGAGWVGERLLVAQGAQLIDVDKAGQTGESLPLPSPALSSVGFDASAAYLVVDRPDGAALTRVEVADGSTRVLAIVDADVPTAVGVGWPLPAPRPSPDGRWVAVSLGRTDRWGIADGDLSRVPDKTLGGATVTCTRRNRNVGPSGVVFDSNALAFAGRAKPVADSPVVGDTRAGGFRWPRPSPARWVVLHHTATRSDSGSLNSLIGQGNGLLSQLYADITPGRELPGEPNTISVHYLVRRDGVVVQLVEERYIARHAGTGQWRNTGPIFDFNSETVGIEIVSPGNDYTPAQIRGVGRLVADICRRRSIPLVHIAGASFVEGVLYHRDFARGLRGKPDPAGWPWDGMMTHATAYLGERR